MYWSRNCPFSLLDPSLPPSLPLSFTPSLPSSLSSSLPPSLPPQVWLGKLSDEMKHTLQQLLVECVREGQSASGGGINPSRYPAQILCLAEQVLFTERCEQALESRTLNEFLIELESQLDGYTNTEIPVSQSA